LSDAAKSELDPESEEAFERAGSATRGSVDLRVLIGVGVFAFALRAIYIAQAWSHPAVRIPVIDAEAYRARALQILEGDWLGDAVYYLDPLYPFFLALVYAVVPEDSIYVLFAQAALDACSAVLLTVVARRVFDGPTAIVAGVIAATYSIFFYYSALLLKAPLMIFLMVAALYFVTRAADADRPSRWIPAGFFLGLAALTRGNSLLFAPALGLWILIQGQGDLARRWISGVLLAVGLLAAILPVSVRNYVVGDDLVLLNSQAGQNFYIGHFDGAQTGAYEAPPFLRPNPVFEESDFSNEARRRTGRDDMKPSEISNFWLKEGFAEISADPGRFLVHSGKKILVLLNGYEIPDNASFDYFRREVGGLLALPLPGFAFVLPLSIAGLILSYRRPLVVVLALFVVTYSAGIVLFFNLSRLRLPIVPALIILAAFAIVEGIRLYRARVFKKLIVPVLALVVFFPITQLDLIDQNLGVRYVNMGVGYLTKSEGFWAGADALRKAGKTEEAAPLVAASFEYRRLAEEQFARALVESPNYPRAARALRRSIVTGAVLLEHLGRKQEFLKAARQIQKRYPRFVGSYVLLGKANAGLGNIEAARGAFNQALRIEPGHAETVRELAALEAAAENGR